MLDIVAKGLQQRYKLPIYAFSVGDDAYSFVEGDASFGIEGIYIDEYKRLMDFDSENGTEIERIVEELFGNKEKILKFQYKNIKCGDYIWDYMMGISFDLKNISKENFKNIISKTLSIIETAFLLFYEKKPSYVVVDEAIKMEGLYACVAAYLGAKVVVPNLEFKYQFIISPIDGKIDAIAKKRGKAFLNAANNDDIICNNYFMYDTPEKNIIDKRLDNGNKNVFIFLHVFSDAPRMSYDNIIYTDYVEWFLDTLKIISDVSNVNWIIRDHPAAKGTNQPIYIKNHCASLSKDNIFYAEDGMSRDYIISKADAIVTCAGDVGLEYWAYGIPTIMLAESFYNDYGISYLMHDKNEYIKTLHSLDSLDTPTEESINTARKIISKYRNSMTTEDSLMRLFQRVRNREIQGIRLEYRDYDLYDYEFIKGYIGLIHQGKIKKSSCYTLDYLLEAE